MCRLYGFLSNEPTKVDCSLVFAQNALMQQSRADQAGLDHTDGWGIAIYQDGVPVVQKQTTAAYNDLLFSATSEKAYSTAIVAHVRRATVGRKSIFNTHPFVSDRWTFAHNGTVTGFDRLRSQLEAETDPDFQHQRRGETDSEQYFLWLLSRLKAASLLDNPPDSVNAPRYREVLQYSAVELSRRCYSAVPDVIPRLNFVLTNGQVLFACRWNHSLFTIERNGLYDCEICGIPHIHHHETRKHRAVVFASEPVTDENWQTVDDHSVVLIDQRFHALA